jgi:hypothetical protein
MDEDKGAASDLQEATQGLEESLETCQKIVSDYRSALLGLHGQASPSPQASSPRD